jgi:hypothetical protein
MTAIVVLGMHRSGTSLVAGALHKMGVHMGSRFREPDETSPYGYWEDLDWRDVNKRILNGAGGTWYDPPPLWRIEREVARLAPRIGQLVSERYNKHSLWGMKDPRTALSIPYLHLCFPSTAIRYVLVKRWGDDVVDSLMRRAEKRGYYEPPEHWRWLSNLYDLRIFAFLNTLQSGYCQVVNFEHFIDPDMVVHSVQSIAAFVGVDSEHAIDSAVASIVLREPANE